MVWQHTPHSSAVHTHSSGRTFLTSPPPNGGCLAVALHALQFVFNVLLLNVLIASMTNSLSKITQVRHSSRLGVCCAVLDVRVPPTPPPAPVRQVDGALQKRSNHLFEFQTSGPQVQQHAWTCVCVWCQVVKCVSGGDCHACRTRGCGCCTPMPRSLMSWRPRCRSGCAHAPGTLPLCTSSRSTLTQRTR